MNSTLIDILKPSKKLNPLATGIKSRGKILTGIKACIFDIYGTLLISGSGDVGTALKQGSTESFSKAFADCGFSAVPEGSIEIIKAKFFDLINKTHTSMRNQGYPFPEINIIEIWSDILSSNEILSISPEIQTLPPEIIAAAYESNVNPIYPMPGVPELLEQLGSLGIRLGIVSNAQFYTSLIFDSIYDGGLDYLGFDESLSIFSFIEKRSKPDTVLFKKLSARLEVYDIAPEEAVFIGNDMLKDIMPADGCGFKTALFAGDKRSLRLREKDDACRNIEPDVIVNRLIDLLDYVQEG